MSLVYSTILRAPKATRKTFVMAAWFAGSYGFKIKVDPNVPWAIPELTHVITMDEMKIPIANKRE